MSNDITKVERDLAHYFTYLIMHLVVIYQCGLQQDLALFAAGDLTEVGEKGLTLR